MAVRKREDAPSHGTVAVPPPISDGYDFVQSLGGIVDEVMRHTHDGETVRAIALPEERPTQGDPEPIELPAPVPDGDDTGTRGADPDNVAPSSA